MGKKSDVGVRETPEFKALQNDEQFRSWLLMQEAAMEIEFTVFDVPELSGYEYTREGLVIAEQEILRRFADSSPWTEENYKLGSRFMYFIGETFVRNFEGKWVALPPQPPKTSPATVVDTEYSSGFYNPRTQMGFVRSRKTGTELTWIFDRAQATYTQWVELGRPGRGTWDGYR
ncbi:hypothetical protein AB0I35_30455 [Nocardia sp. NPDC050378]|uniref:hypothetical protein n=1 Tax=Nocardia sp. NPDC050378 TaxID=3155400 RepID=UPI0033EB9F13